MPVTVSHPAFAEHVGDRARTQLRAVADWIGAVDLDDRAVESAVELIASAPTTRVCLGVGKSGYVAGKVAATLTSLGLPATAVHPCDACHGDLGLVGAGGTVMAFSHSGETAEITSLLPILLDRGCRLIAVTASATSTVARGADVVLAYGSVVEIDGNGLAPTTSTSVAQAVGDVVTVNAAAARRVTPAEFHSHHPAGSLGRRLQRVAAVMRPLNEVARVRRGVGVSDMLLAMTAVGSGLACVIDASGHLHGVVSDGDVRRALTRGERVETLNVDALLQPAPHVTTPDRVAADVVSATPRTTLPVVERDGRLVGALVATDLL